MNTKSDARKDQIPLRSRLKTMLPTPLHPVARRLGMILDYMPTFFSRGNPLTRFFATNTDRLLNRILSNDQIIRKEALKYDYYFGVEKKISNVGYRFGVDKAANLLDFKSVLDVGCGNGFSVSEFIKRGYEAKGTDISKYVVEHPIPELHGKHVLVTAPASALPFSDNSFDLVFCTDVMEHIPEKEVKPSIREMARVARRHLFFTISIHESSSHNTLEYHTTLRPRSWWESTLTATGLERMQDIERAIQGSDQFGVNGADHDVEYFVYSKSRVANNVSDQVR